MVQVVTSTMHALADLLLGTEQAQRLRLSQSGFAIFLMVFCFSVTLFAARLSGVALAPLVIWAGVSMAGLLSAYWAIRSSWSMRFADPPPTLQQMVFALASSAWGYTLAPPVRAIAFPILMVMAGLTEYRIGETAERTLERAEKLLYEAKAQGRNRVVSA